MKTNLLFILILLSLSGCRQKQHESLPLHGLLWEITGNSLKTPSYLFGTYHGSGGMQILDSIKAFDSIYNSTNQLVCEAKNDFVTRPILTKKKDTNKSNNSLKPWPVADSTYANLLTFRQKNILDSVLNTDKVLYIKQANLRPSSLMIFLRFSFKRIRKERYVKTSDDPVKGMLDWHLQDLAKKYDMNIIGLDSTEEYKAIMDSISSHVSQRSYRAEVDMLMYYIENHSKIASLKRDIYNRALESYLKQDLSFSLNLNQQQQEEINLTNNKYLFYLGNDKFSELRNKLIIDERNNYWMKKIPNLIKGNSCFIAVGAAHLGGEKGIINQLRGLDYTVVAIKEFTK